MRPERDAMRAFLPNLELLLADSAVEVRVAAIAMILDTLRKPFWFIPWKRINDIGRENVNRM